MDTWCCRVASLNVGSARGLVLHSLFALWPRGISFGPGRRWALELRSRALWYLPPEWLGSWWHEKRQIDASPARVTLIREVPPKVQTTSPKNGKNGLFWVRWSAIWANAGTQQTRPPTTATFPRHTAAKSPPQQHDMSSLRVIGHVVLLGSHLACLGMPFSSARGPAIPSLGCLILTWTRYSEPGQPRPHAEQAAHVRNSGFTCGTRWNPGRCRTRPIHDGSWGTHTQARDAVFTGTRQTRPTKIVTFPRDKAEKSPC